MNTQPEALRLAERLEDYVKYYDDAPKAAAELRRLHEMNAVLLEALKAFMPGAEAMGWNTDKARAAIAKAQGESK